MKKILFIIPKTYKPNVDEVSKYIDKKLWIYFLVKDVATIPISEMYS